MKKVFVVLVLLVMVFTIGCAGVMEKVCKKSIKINNDISEYIPIAIQMVEEGKLSQSDFDKGMKLIDIINKGGVSACELKEIWQEIWED